MLTEFGTFDYVVTRVFAVNEYGSGRVLEQTDEPTLVLTTCHPKYFSSERYIVTPTACERERRRLGRRHAAR